VADFVFNVAKGKVAEYAARVNANDPTNSALVIVVLATSGLESDATLLDKDTLSDVVSGTTNEVTNTNYARKILDNTAGITITVDDTNDRVDVDIPDQTWTNVAAGDGWSKLLVCFDGDTTGGTDVNIIPLTSHDFAVTPDGSNITAQIAAAGFFRAS
jgi:hypothetical protein